METSPTVSTATVQQDSNQSSSQVVVITKPKPTKPKKKDDQYSEYEKPSTEELAAQSRRIDVLAQRELKRKQKLGERRGMFPPKQSSLAAAAAPDNLVMMGDTVVVDAEGNPIKESMMVEMIAQFAASRNKSYEEARAFLNQYYKNNAQTFALEFASLMNDKSQAWRSQKQQIDFHDDGEQDKANADEGNGWAGDDASFGDMMDSLNAL